MQSLIPQWLVTNVCSSPKHIDHVYPKNILDNSMLQSYRTILAEPFGDNLADYAIPLTNGSRLHIKEYYTIYKIHWDAVDPSKNFIGHLIEDAPHWIAIGIGAAVGAAIGIMGDRYISKKK